VRNSAWKDCRNAKAENEKVEEEKVEIFDREQVLLDIDMLKAQIKSLEERKIKLDRQNESLK